MFKKAILHLKNLFLYILACILVLLPVLYCLAFIFLGIESRTEYFPKEGDWFCEEIQLQLSFDYPQNCHIIVNGEKIKCICTHEIRGSWIYVECYEPNSEYYSMGEEVFRGNSSKLDGHKLILSDPRSGNKYTFIYIPDSS